MYYSIRRRNTINTRTISKIPAPGDLYYVYPDDVTKRNPNDNDKEGDPIPEAIEEVQEEVEEEETKDRVPIMEIF
jgi:hypothetical protein